MNSLQNAQEENARTFVHICRSAPTIRAHVQSRELVDKFSGNLICRQDYVTEGCSTFVHFNFIKS